MPQNERDKSERLAAIAEEFEMEDLEEEMAGKSPEERMKIIEREGGSREHMLAVRKRTRAKLAEKLATPSEAPEVEPASTQKPPPEKSNVTELRTFRERVTRWAPGPAMGFAAAAAIAGIYVTARHIDLNPTTPPLATTAATPPGQGIDLSTAYGKRMEGMSLCGAHQYQSCLEWLDRANVLDPGGEEGWPRVQAARYFAEEALGIQRDK
jgi:hypothetical protein